MSDRLETLTEPCWACGHERAWHDHYREGTDCSHEGCTCLGMNRRWFKVGALIAFVVNAIEALRVDTTPIEGDHTEFGMGVQYGPFDVLNAAGRRSVSVRLPGNRVLYWKSAE